MTKEELLDGLSIIESRIDTLWYEVEQCDEISPYQWDRLYDARGSLLEAIKELEDKLYPPQKKDK